MRLPLPTLPALPRLTAGTPRDAGDPVLNVAHRGASAHAPENTLAAVRAAVARGADLVELDVQRSRDGALVLLHDESLARTTNVEQVYPGRAPWRVADLTYDELARLDAGSWKSREHVGEPVPTLGEAVEVLRGSRTGLLLELKAPHLHPGMVGEVVAALQAVPGYVDEAVAAGRLVVESFDLAAVRRHRALDPRIPVGVLGSPPRSALPHLATWADQVNPHHRRVDPAYVAQLHDLGLECLVWTVNHPAAMRRAVRLGVDGVITDRPDVLRRTLLGYRAAA